MIKRRAIALLGATTLLLTIAVVPAQADPPEQSEEPIMTLFLDDENHMAVFWNVTRDDFCAWEAGGFDGPPPVQELVPAAAHETGQGAVVGTWRATRHLELWDVSEVAEPSGPCEDTAGLSGPWATGYGASAGNDNDLDVSGTRTNSFGDHVQGTVQDGDGGQWHYSSHFRAHIDRDFEFTVKTVNTNLKKKGK